MTFKIDSVIMSKSDVSSRDRLVVRTLRCGRSNPGSNPGHGSDLFFYIVENLCVENRYPGQLYMSASVV